MIVAGLRSVLVLVCVAGCATACTAKTKVGPTTYVTVDAPQPAVTSAPPSTPAPSAATPAPSPSSSAPAVAMRRLPGECDGLLPLGSVVDALGRTVTGGTAFVVGTADQGIGRVGYINCRYGVTRKTKPPKIEIGVSLYKTPAKAAARIRPTVDDFTAHAARASRVDVAGHEATLLEGGVGDGYGPTIVLTMGQRTIAVSFRDGAVAATKVTKDLSELAQLAERRTASR